MYWWISFPILWVVFVFCWWFSLPYENFLVWCSSICLFFYFVSLAWGDICNKIVLWTISEILLPVFSSRIFMAMVLIFQSLILFKFTFVCGIRRWSSFIFLHICVQFFPVPFIELTIFSPLCACFLCQILIDYKDVGLFLGSLFWSIVLCVCSYASTMLFWLLWPHSIVLY